MTAKLVVVDDTEHVRKMLVQMLELDGFSVVGEAANGNEAVRLAAVVDPDVVVMDYMMPGVDGLAAARRIKELRPEQPIILYTAFLDAKLRREAKEAGVSLCLGKVEGLNLLERHIRSLVRGFGVG